jgi:CBS domain-containing protein
MRNQGKKPSRSIRTIDGGPKRAQRPTTRKGSLARAGGRSATRRVEDVMVPDVVTIAPSASLVEAARAMEQANVGMLPVVEGRAVRGVITDRDIVIRAIARDADLAKTRVAQCLTDDVVCAHPDWTTDQAMKAMADARVGRLPVVDEGDRLVGVVTLSSMAFRAPDQREALDTSKEVSRRSARAGER